MSDWTPEPWPTFNKAGLSLTSHDPRNRDFPVRALLPRSASARHDRRWRRWRAGWDQAGGTCVPHAELGAIVTSPNLSRVPIRTRRTLQQPLAYVLYREMQLADEWPGESPAYEGTSTLAGAKVMVARGLAPGYRWCFGVDDVIDSLINVGPVVTGLNWRMDAAYPHFDGTPDPNRGTQALGGHETYLFGYDHEGRMVEGWNSWGPGFGLLGRFRWPVEYLAERLADDGDALVFTA